MKAIEKNLPQPETAEEQQLYLTIQALREMDALQQALTPPPQDGATIRTLEDAAAQGYFARDQYPALWTVEEYYRSGGRTEQPPVELSFLHEAGYVPEYVLELLHGGQGLPVEEIPEQPEQQPQDTVAPQDEERLRSLLQLLLGR